MDIISTSRILPPQRRMQSFNFVESFKNPWDKPGKGQRMQIIQWDNEDWTYTSNGCITIRQVRGTAQARTARHNHAADSVFQPRDVLVFPLLVEKVFQERNANTGEWHCFSNSTVEHDFYKNASLAWREEAMGQLLGYGLKNIFLLSHIQGIVVAEDHEKKLLHFMFDGGQGFLSNAPMWAGG